MRVRTVSGTTDKRNYGWGEPPYIAKHTKVRGKIVFWTYFKLSETFKSYQKAQN